ncbi:hypothetical protein AB0I94_12000 [Streptomyces sp. NPDC050147]|uniref:hypothetical protein n=1 Tax=Streptomyces sp. NPDC050147 TaxID=3155513 RepID=UPI00342C9F9F
MRIRTAFAVTALTAAAVLGASGTALADNDDDLRGGFAYENLGGHDGITGAAGHFESDDNGHDNGYDNGHDDDLRGGFTYENLGGHDGITKATGYCEGNDDNGHDDNGHDDNGDD